MRKPLSLAVVCAISLFTAVATADDEKSAAKAEIERVTLQQQIADLKVRLAKERQRAQEARDRAEDEAQRAEDEAKRARRQADEERRKAEAALKQFAAKKKASTQVRRRFLILGGPNFIHRPQPKPQPGPEQLEHLRAAIKHLTAAGQKELAHEAAKRAERLQAELHRREPHGDIQARLRELSMAVGRLHEQMRGLQENVERLQKQLKSR